MEENSEKRKKKGEKFIENGRKNFNCIVLCYLYLN